MNQAITGGNFHTLFKLNYGWQRLQRGVRHRFLANVHVVRTRTDKTER